VYLDITAPALGQVLDRKVAEALLKAPIDTNPKMRPSDCAIDRAVNLIATAKKPVLLFGKGAAYAQVEELLKQLVESTGIPFYPMSMAKGLLPDTHPMSAIACRSQIMQDADLVVLVGARLNWLLGRGKDKWNPKGKFIQLDISPEEIDCNRHIDAPVIGDLGSSLTALINKLKGATLSIDPTWLPSLQSLTKEKNVKMAERLTSTTVPMTHWSALAVAKPIIEANPDVILINEGANTLDDTRNAINMQLPRHRIDCATWAIMGMGMGSAIGASVSTGKQVVAIVGDSAFGFSGMDFSTICRYQLPVTVCVFNNGGIYNGIGKSLVDTTDPAPTTLDINARYDKLGEAFGGKTYYVTTPAEFAEALTESLRLKVPTLIDVQLAADAGVESGHIGYLNPASLVNITV
jgi:oxalyl-CoA decarboxylase